MKITLTLFALFALFLALACVETPGEPEQIWAPSGYSKIGTEYVGNTLCQVFDFYETWDENTYVTINKVQIHIPPIGADQDQYLYNAFYDGINNLLLTYDVLEAAFEWPIVKAASSLTSSRVRSYDNKWQWKYTLRVWLQQKSASAQPYLLR